MPLATYAPSEAAIEASIDRRIGSSGFFQRVAEQLARGLYPELAGDVVPYGRLANDKTIRGWPDAYLTRTDGKLIAIEATTAAQAERDHWPKDLEKLKSAPEYAGIVWVSWSNPSSPKTQILMREAAQAQGLAPESVKIIFRKEVCSRLREPFHARFWVNDLGLISTSSPWISIWDFIRRRGTRQTRTIFPAISEFENGSVHSPESARAIENTLAVHGRVLVLGHGAAGKTTLGMLLSYLPRYIYAPVYYLDLSATAVDQTLSERAEEVLAATADKGVLYIIDNAHLNPQATSRLFDRWLSYRAGSDMLILARKVRAKVRVWEADPELEALDLPQFDLVVQPRDLEGVFRRQYRLLHNVSAPALDEALLHKWHRLFGGDLMSFSAAVVGLLEEGGEAALLKPEHARDYVRNHYLEQPELASEQSALLDLAAVAEIEGYFPSSALKDGALEKSIRRGIVWVESRDRRGLLDGYRLPHPGLGTLLRAAAGTLETSRQARCRVLAGHPAASIMLSRALAKRGEEEEAAEILQAMWAHTVWPLEKLPFHWWANCLDSTRELSVLSEQQMLSRLEAWLSQPDTQSKLGTLAGSTNFDNTLSFLRHAQQSLPGLADHMREAISRNPEIVARRALTGSLAGFPDIMRYAASEVPDAAEIVMKRLLDDPDHFTEQAIRKSFSHLSSFIKYCDQEIPGASSPIKRSLAAKADLIVDMLTGSAFCHLRSFVADMEADAPDVYRAVFDALKARREQLIERALSAPLKDLVLFYQFANLKMPDATRQIQLELSREPVELIERLLASPPDLLPVFHLVKQEMPDLAGVLEEQLNSKSERFESVIAKASLGSLTELATAPAVGVSTIAKSVLVRLVKDPKGLTERVLQTPVPQVVPFLVWVSDTAPEAAATLDRDMTDHVDQVCDGLAARPPIEIRAYLDAVEDRYPVLAKSVRDRFVRDRKGLSERVLQTPVAQVVPFLVWLSDTAPETAATLDRDMANHVDTLCNGLAGRPPIEIRTYLDALENRYPVLAKSMLASLETLATEIAAKAAGAPISETIRLLIYSRTRMPAVYVAISNHLFEHSNDVRGAVSVLSGTQLTELLDLVGDELPWLRAIIRRRVAEVGRDEWIQEILAAPLNQVPSLLNRAREHAPGIETVVRRALISRYRQVAQRALGLALGDIHIFLEYAYRKMPELAGAVCWCFLQERPRLADCALRSSLDHLTSFLSFIGTRNRPVAEAIHKGLVLNRNDFAKTALTSPFDHLAAFLRYAKVELPRVYSCIEEAMLSLPAKSALLRRSLDSGPEAMTPLLLQSSSFPGIVKELDREQWSRRWSNARTASPGWFRSFAASCHQISRGDLAAAVAAAIIKRSHANDFPMHVTTLVQISYILCSQHDLGEDEVRAFLTRCIPDAWMDGQYRNPACTLGGLAGVVRIVALDDRPWLRNLFCSPELWARIEREQPRTQLAPPRVAAWLQLFGGGRLLKPDLAVVPGLGLAGIGEALEIFPPGEPNVGIQSIQATMWFGLKEWCFATGETVKVDARLGDRILDQFLSARPPEESRMDMLNRQMIDWLDAGQRNEWELSGLSQRGPD